MNLKRYHGDYRLRRKRIDERTCEERTKDERTNEGREEGRKEGRREGKEGRKELGLGKQILKKYSCKVEKSL